MFINDHFQVIEGSADQRVTLKLNIHVGNISLNDQVLFDLIQALNCYFRSSGTCLSQKIALKNLLSASVKIWD